ncbi:MAG: Omp28-related outer membrane protein [Sphingobacteriales bacterium]|nr:MAG: Omp28-related outer membrane protein [Sphingobacteriales bacterium]
MKRNHPMLAGFFLFWTFLLVVFNSCKEIPPYIDFTETLSDTTYVDIVESPQIRLVILEEFTGVRCVNCPAGHEVSKALLAANPNRFAYMVLHAGFLTQPYADSQQQFVIDETTFLYDFLEVPAVPAAAINRVQYSGENFLSILNPNSWGAKVALELQKPTPVNLTLSSEYDSNNRNLRITARIHYTQEVSADNNLSLFLAESHIVDPQLIPDGTSSIVNLEYEHNHVVRKMLTAPQGLVLNVEKIPGRVVVKVFEITLPEAWNADNCEVIGFVHNAGVNKEILQGATIKIVE